MFQQTCFKRLFSSFNVIFSRNHFQMSPGINLPHFSAARRRNFHVLTQLTCATEKHTKVLSHQLLIRNQFYTVSGLVSTLWESVGFTGRLKHRKYVLRNSSLRLYLCCVELVDHDVFIRELQLPDTFYSWFKVLELHVWMCMVRLAQEGKEGIVLRNFMMEFLWQDLDKKTRKLGAMMTSAARRKSITDMSEHLKFSLYCYDEGLMGDDKVLASALWRNVFECKCEDAEKLAGLVAYVRKQIAHLDTMDSTVIQTAGLFTFLPLHETPEAVERNRQILVQIAKRV